MKIPTGGRNVKLPVYRDRGQETSPNREWLRWPVGKAYETEILMKTHTTEEKTHHTYRELPDGTELELTTTVFLTMRRGWRKADSVEDVDYDATGYDADGTPHALTDDETTSLKESADEIAGEYQRECNDTAEAQAEDAWDARNDR